VRNIKNDEFLVLYNKTDYFVNKLGMHKTMFS